jgi:ABC-type dipeptide/oligopeptide/nickel transport system permease component
MFQYIVRRIVQFIPVFFGVTLILFLVTTILPGDPVQMKIGEKQLSPELHAQLLKAYGLDQPWYVQYVKYLSALSPVHVAWYNGEPHAGDTESARTEVGHVVIFTPVISGAPPSGAVVITRSDGNSYTWGTIAHLNILGASVVVDPPDLGQSISSGKAVTDIIAQTYPYTMQLAFAAIIIEMILGLGAGIISAVKQFTFWDVLVTVSTAVLVSLPVFWLGILLQFVFGIWLKELTNGNFYLPISGVSGEFPPGAYLILPAVTLAAVSTAYVARIMRSQLLEVQGQDYVRTAYAKGLSGRRVLMGHQMKNALIPVITFIGLDLGAMLSGAILTETVFNYPGIGYAIYQAIRLRDFPVVFGGTVVILFAVMIVNLAVDISYAFLDPRIRYGNSGKE